MGEIAFQMANYAEIFHTAMPVSNQEAFASNLPSALGTAILNPVPLRTKSGRVGDIGFFQQDGKYHWIRNAFHTIVREL